MKKVLFTLFSYFLFFAALCAQQAIKVGPLGFILGNYNLRYEKAIGEKSSFQVGVNFYDYKLLDLQTTGFGIEAGYRKYFKEAIQGPYFYPAATFRSNTSKVTDTEKGSFSALNLGASLGYQWVAKGGFVTDLSLGAALSTVLSKDANLTGNYAGVLPRINVLLGYSF